MDSSQICIAAAAVLAIATIAYLAWRQYRRRRSRYTYATMADTEIVGAGLELADKLESLSDIGRRGPADASDGVRYSVHAVAQLALPVASRLRDGPSTYAKYHAVYASLTENDFSGLGGMYKTMGISRAEKDWLTQFGKELSTLPMAISRLGVALALE